MSFKSHFDNYIINPVNNYIITPVNDNVVKPVNDNLITPMNDNIVQPIFRPINTNVFTPINNNVFRPINNGVNSYVIKPVNDIIRPNMVEHEELNDTYNDTDNELIKRFKTSKFYTSFDDPSRISHESNEPLLNTEEQKKEEFNYYLHFTNGMCLSGSSFKQSFYYFVNSIFPNIFENECKI